MKTCLRIMLIAFFVGGLLAGAVDFSEAAPKTDPGDDCVRGGEPCMEDYSRRPIFSAATTPPNILVILDNSGSMGNNAYGPTTVEGGLRPDSDPFDPRFYKPVKAYEVIRTYRVNRPEGDAEELINTGEVEAYHWFHGVS